ncbi:FAD-dependent oxidoreductase [Marmoricola sp. RAF53]|uniref:FAD-dependent oxidoreductase n=1 Tax=Marmoricola sp. RAF53 TaxID=3233059 RepID=UPI003F9716D5
MTDRTKVVVVGAGMVGHRFVDELVRGDADRRFEIELIGAEEYEPYNRILLSEVLAGRADLRALGLPLPDADRVLFRRGVAADAIDTAAREVLLSDGGRASYDHLVLATGARAFVPPLPGLARPDGQSDPKHVHVLRTLDDTRNVAARAMNAKHAVVLGGGLLGLEAACGLRRRGVPVTVVDLDTHLMATQLDGPPARMLAARLRSLGVDVVTGTSVAEVISAYDEIVAVRLTDDRLLAADLMIVSCGIRAETGLAAAAGITVDRGIVVDEELRTSDPHVFAVGDCAQPPGGMSGLLAPGWRQAEDLAGCLLGGFGTVAAQPPQPPRAEPVKLKAAGVDLVTMGVRASQAGDHDRVVSVSDGGGNRHADLVLRPNERGDSELVGVTCLGFPDVSAALTLAYDRRTPLPVDPLALLVPASAGGAVEESPSPMRMPGSTTVCRCSGVTKKQIVTAWEEGAATVDAVAGATRATTGCGGCKEVVCGLVDWLNASDPGAAPAAVSTPVTERNMPVESRK